MAFVVGMEDENEPVQSSNSKDTEVLVDYKQYYAKSNADDNLDIESRRRMSTEFYRPFGFFDETEGHRTGDKTVLIGVHVPKHRPRRRRRKYDDDSDEEPIERKGADQQQPRQSDTPKSSDGVTKVTEDVVAGFTKNRLSVQGTGGEKFFLGLPATEHIEETASSDRLRELLIGDDARESHMLFCELEELQDGEWHERARWVRFEEDVEEGGGRWSKPFVATLSLHALFELRQCLSVGVVMLDIKTRSFKELVGLIADSLIGHNQLESSLREEFICTLLSRHIHQHEHGHHGLRRGLSEIGKKFSSRKMDEAGQHQRAGSPGVTSKPQGVESPAITPKHHSLTKVLKNSSQRLGKDRKRSLSLASCSEFQYNEDNNAGAQVASGLGAPTQLVSGIAGLSVPSNSSLTHLNQHPEVVHKPNEHFARKLGPGTEASSTLVGAVEYLNHTVSAFVRLSNGIYLDDLTEVAVPTRFVFVMLGPSARAKDYHEIGRAMATIMSDDIFRDVAYRSRDRSDMLTGLDEFLDEVTILPPGEWDPTIRIQPPKSVPSQEERKLQALKEIAEEQGETPEGMIRAASSGRLLQSGQQTGMKKNASAPDMTEHPGGPGTPGASSVGLAELGKKLEEEEEAGGHNDPALFRTGRLFGGLIEDVKRKAPFYLSDISDAFHIQTVAAVLFMFFACISPLVTFGGLLGLATDNHIAAFECILTGAVCGTTYHIFAGQPLTIISSTGPVLVFEKILYSFTLEYGLNFLTFRFWIGIWTAIILMLLVAFDLSALVQLITRFTEECFAFLISTIFIFEALFALYKLYKDYPVAIDYPIDIKCLCAANATAGNASLTTLTTSPSTFTVAPTEAIGGQAVTAAALGDGCSAYNISACASIDGCSLVGPECGLNEPVPDVFFFSCLCFIGTFGLSMFLKAFQNTSFFPHKIREIISDFAVFISISLMVLIDYLVGLNTPKLAIPKTFTPTRPDRPWVVLPFENPVWTIPAAIAPALLLSILLFMDQQITAVIVNRREHKLQKGKGYHLDLFVLTLQIVFCATLGLPYFVAATVLAINHVNSLRKQSETSAPGEQPKFLGIREQRVTGFLIFALIGCAIPLKSVLLLVPMPVLYGVFLYMGVSALKCSQFFDRILLIFMPVKYQPDSQYLRHMKTWRVHLFTAIQLASFAFLWIVKKIKEISITFPLMLVVMVIIRKLLDYVFTQDELHWVDDILPKNPLAVHDPKSHPSPPSRGSMPSCQGSSGILVRSCSRTPGTAPLQDKVKVTDEVNRTTIWQRLTNRHRRSLDNGTTKCEMEPLKPGENGGSEKPPTIVVVTPSRNASIDELKT